MTEPRQSEKKRTRLRIVVSGRVQGVGFRYATVREAERLGLLGWVRNTYDGNVEIVAEGPQDSVSDLLVWCRAGPPSARVDSATHREEPSHTPLQTFEVRF